ncbi:MAG: DNA-formamidopyrimidine glycosylase family protein, partial [Trebonia sp.]
MCHIHPAAAWRARPDRRSPVPELPEVETVRAGIEHHVVGRTIAAVEVFN